MGAFFSNIVKSIRDFWQSREKRQKIWLIVAALGIIVAALIITVILVRVEYAVLYQDLTDEQTGQVQNALSEMGVRYRTEGTVTYTVFVPEEMVSRLRADLALQGFTAISGFNYDRFAGSTGFGTTDAERHTIDVYSRQEMIATQILQLDKIVDCTVLLSIPQRQTFVLSSDNMAASASVVLETRDGEPLTNAEARSIANIVINGSHPTMTRERITIVDKNSNYYDLMDDDADDEEISIVSDSEVRERLALEKQARENIENQIRALLTPVFGYSRVQVAVHLKLDFDSVRSESIVFAPPVPGELQGMIRSMQESLVRYDEDGVAEGVPGTDPNGMGMVTYPWGEDDEGRFEEYMRTINYEINQTTTQIEQAKGNISELSIAVVVDASVFEEDYTGEVRRLAANALGIPESRVSAEQIPFSQLDGLNIADALDQQRQFREGSQFQEFLMTGIICFTVLLLTLAVLLIVRSFKKKKEPEPVLADGGLDVTVGEDDDYLIDYAAEGYDEYPEYAEGEGEDEEKSRDAISEIKELIGSDPSSVAQLLRNWLSDEY